LQFRRRVFWFGNRKYRFCHLLFFMWDSHQLVSVTPTYDIAEDCIKKNVWNASAEI
jgi:hypothetical protein